MGKLTEKEKALRMQNSRLDEEYLESIKSTIQWYKKKYPLIEKIQPNRRKLSTFVMLEGGYSAVVKCTKGDEWNVGLGITHAYIDAYNKYVNGEYHRKYVAGQFKTSDSWYEAPRGSL